MQASDPQPKPASPSALNLSDRSDRVPFFVGVSGAMDLHPDDLPGLRLRIRAIFEWLRAAPCAEHGDVAQTAALDEVARIHGALAAVAKPDGSVNEVKREGWTGLGLGTTPIIVLTSMAPGADQLVFEVAQAMGFGIEVPLPFPPDVMPTSTTYTGMKRPTGTGDVLPWRGAEILEGLIRYRVECAGDRAARPSDGPFRQMASGTDPADRTARRIRYRAVGEFIAVHSDLPLAIDDKLDDRDLPDPGILSDLTRCGTDSVVQARRLGPTHGLLPLPPALDWSDNGPVFHLRARRMDAAVLAGRSEEHERLLAEAHDLLATLGRDALDENSDWFVLHRTHPVAPINLH